MSITLLPAGGDNVIGELVVCARAGCDTEFNKTTHNQKYCTNECCRIETNRKIMENYHKTRAILNGTKKRVCESCGTPLSRYNKNDYCGACEIARREEHSGDVANLVASVSWL